MDGRKGGFIVAEKEGELSEIKLGTTYYLRLQYRYLPLPPLHLFLPSSKQESKHQQAQKQWESFWIMNEQLPLGTASKL